MANNNGTTPATHISEKDWLVTLLLCLFCGGIGVHRYYVGKIGTGILGQFKGYAVTAGVVELSNNVCNHSIP